MKYRKKPKPRMMICPKAGKCRKKKKNTPLCHIHCGMEPHEKDMGCFFSADGCPKCILYKPAPKKARK